MTSAWRLMAGCLLVGLLIGAACNDDDDDGLLSGRDVSFDDLGDALGCDEMDEATYEPFNYDGVMIDEEARDCFSDGRFVGRVHIFGDMDAAEAMDETMVRFTGPPSPPHTPACVGEGLRAIVGKSWAVVTGGDDAAENVQTRTGGRLLQQLSHTIGTYGIPCIED